MKENSSLNLHLRIVHPNAGGKDPRRYNCHTASEVGVLIVTVEDEASSGRELILQLRGGGLKQICDSEGCFMPLRFPLIHTMGENGWHSGIPLAPNGLRSVAGGADDEVDDDDDGGRRVVAGDDRSTEVKRRGRGGSTRVSQSQFGAFYLHERDARGTYSVLHLSERLFQEWTVALWATVEASRVRWHRLNQDTLRADSWKGAMDALADGNAATDIGKRVILGSTFTGGPRHMMQCYQDAMAMVRELGKPDLFITVTCNPAWQEIVNELAVGQSVKERPDLCSRVFKIKLNEIIKDLTKKKTSLVGSAVGCTQSSFRRGDCHTPTYF